MSFLILPGVPIAQPAWSRLTLDLSLHVYSGLYTPQPRQSWLLSSFVDEVLPLYDDKTILVGHDIGGLIGAVASTKKTPRALVLTGTALGNWWWPTRLSALPILRLFFYHTFQGRLFTRFGHRKQTQLTLSPPTELPHFAESMRRLAAHASPPKHLAASIPCPVYLIWGKQDRWYPPFLAKRLSRLCTAPLHWIDGGHYIMYEHPHTFEQLLINIHRSMSHN